MHDTDAIEAINHEQLVTATDRLLLRGGAARRRDSVPALNAQARLAEGSSPFLVPLRLCDGSSPDLALALGTARAHAPLACSRLVRASSAAVYLGHPPVAHAALAQLAPGARAYVGHARPRATRAYASPAPRSVSRWSGATARSAEPTVVVRAVRPRAFPVAVVIPMLVGIVVGLAAML